MPPTVPGTYDMTARKDMKAEAQGPGSEVLS